MLIRVNLSSDGTEAFAAVASSLEDEESEESDEEVESLTERTNEGITKRTEIELAEASDKM